MQSGVRIQFEIRLVEGLAKKPEQRDTDQERKDPFMPPYVEDLYIAEETVIEEDGDEESFVVLLNKYPVIPRHFLLVTKVFQRQASYLTPNEILSAYTILAQLGKREKHMMFYNSGDKSGAS